MLFLTFGNLLMLSIQFVSDRIRYWRYWHVMQRLLRTAGILVHRRSVQSSNLLRTSSLNLSESSGNLEFTDDHIRISSLQPVQEIDLSSWTAYTSYLEYHNSVQEPNQNICILMEARRPIDMNKFVISSLKISPAYRVHVLSLACPIAWKTAEPFGIILHCSFSSLVALTDAFGQNRLTLDEDLELSGFSTVTTTGNPQKLVPQLEEYLSVKEVGSLSRGDHHAIDYTSFERNEGAQTDDVSSQGSQSAVSGTENISILISQQQPIVHNKHQPIVHNEQQLIAHPDISSNNNFEVDHTETFVVSQSTQIDAKSFSKQTSQISQTSVPGLHSDSLLDNGKNGHDKSRMKPPNILVYCGIKDSSRKFAQVRSSLEACINTEAYTIYHLKHDSLLSDPWRSNAALLVISSCTHLRQEAETEIIHFVLEDGGALLSFNSSVDCAFAERLEEEGIDGERLGHFKFKDDQYITSVRGKFFYSGLNENCEIIVPYEICRVQNSDVNNVVQQKSSTKLADNSVEDNDTFLQNKALVVKIKCEGGGLAVLSQLLLDRDPTEFAKDQDSFAALKQSNTTRIAILHDILTSLCIDTSSGAAPTLTPCLLLAQRVGLKESFLESFRHRLKDDNLLKSQKMSLKFMQYPDQSAVTSTCLPVITNSNFGAQTEYFNPQVYWKNLKTRKLGQILFYTDVITSTMSVFDGLQFSIPDDIGLIAVAGRQTSGRGRGGNSWLSPAGCAMFTLPLNLSVYSELGQRVSFLQHMISLSVVHSVLTLPGYENLNLKLKWPNDIYYGKEMKLGGVLVLSTVIDSTIYATIGCGFNVGNSNPTICINDIIRLRNLSHPQLPELAPLNSSQLIARTMNCLEDLLHSFEKDGHQNFCEQYYKCWLHGNSKVHLQLDKDTEGVIVGLDDFGFLRVRTADGIISVQPDGNSFDMLHNLIHTQSRP